MAGGRTKKDSNYQLGGPDVLGAGRKVVNGQCFGGEK